MAPPDEDDRKAKDVLEAELDPATRRDLERWFGLPSFEEAAEKNLLEEHPDVVKVREQREKAMAAADPALLEELRLRSEPPMHLFKLATALDEARVRIDPTMPLMDYSMIDRADVVVEPREIEIPEELRDDLKDCTPQAILRDLHRSEQDFDKVFEIVDFGAEQRLDIVAEVASAMATNWKLPALDDSPWTIAMREVRVLRAERRQPWAAWFSSQPLPNRKWSPEEDR